MGDTVVIVGWYVPGIGPRSISTAICHNSEEENRAIERAIAHMERYQLEALVVDSVDAEAFFQDPKSHADRLRQQALEAYHILFPEEVGQEQPAEEDYDA